MTNPFTHTITRIAAASFVTALIFTPMAFADRTVTFDRAELANEETALDLIQSITLAAHDVCLEENRNLAMPALSMRLCVDATIKTAVNDINAPCLNIVFNEGLLSETELKCHTQTYSD